MARAAKTVSPAEPTATPLKDELGDRLIAAGLINSTYTLDINRTLTTPYEMDLEGVWSLPSRLFRFPIEVSDFDADGPRRMGLMHPLLADHPFVVQVSEAMGEVLMAGGAPNRFGYTKTDSATWWHAVDLMNTRHWRDLLATREFTSDEAILQAVAFSVSHCGDDAIDTKIARQVLAALGVAEPTDGLALLCKLDRPTGLTGEDNVVRYPVNTGGQDGADLAWCMVLGLERGWLKYRGRFIEWSETGRERYAAGPGALFVEATNGQGAFAF